MKKITIIIMVVTIVSKMFGFLRDIVLSYYYGASYISDAYLIALIIPGAIFAIVGIGISTSYIPMFNKVLKMEGAQNANRFTSNLINIVLIITLIIITITFSFTEPIVKVFASGFTEDNLNLTVSFTRITLFGIIFTGVIYIFNGYLQSMDSFLIPALTGIPLNIILIASIMLSDLYNVYYLAIGSVIATSSQLLLLIPFVVKKGYVHNFKINLDNVYVKKMLFLSLPVIIGVSINQINILIDKTIASNIVVGGISSLTYAERLNIFVQGIFVLPVVTAIYPSISRMAAAQNIKKLKETLSQSIIVIALLVIPATVGAMIFSSPIITLVYGRGEFNAQAIQLTSSALFFYSLGMIGVGIRELFSRVFYSLQDTKTPMINAAIAVIINIILNIILSRYLGIGGLALATSISALVCAVLLYISLIKKIGPIKDKKLSLILIKIFFGSLGMGIISKTIYLILLNELNMLFSLVISVGFGIFIYLIYIYSLKISMIISLVKSIKMKFV